MIWIGCGRDLIVVCGILLVLARQLTFVFAGCAIQPDANGHVDIPSTSTSIADSAFKRCSSLKSVNIPDSVTSIGGAAFYECTSLTSITIGDSVTSIGDGAFDDCISLTSIAIPDSVTSIGYSAFLNCKSLTSITIPQAFHSEDEASRLGLDELWPDGFALPDSSSK